LPGFRYLAVIHAICANEAALLSDTTNMR